MIEGCRLQGDNRPWLIIGLVLGLRTLFFFFSPLDLSPDEAYYWDWSRHLDWGYYSKPPMVAWLIGASTGLLGHSSLAVRLPALVFSIVDLLIVFQVAKRLYGERAGIWAAALSAAMPGGALLGFIMTIDAPLLLFWSLSLYCLLRALDHGEREKSGWWWIGCGVASGLGLLSKQTMAAFWALAGLGLLIYQDGRRWLKTPWPWLSGVICLFFLLPVVFWNWQNGWITLQHTAHHFQGDSGSDGPWTPIHLLELILSQAAVASPLTLVLMFLPVRCLKKERRGKHDMMLASLGLGGLALVSLLSLRQPINANWPAPFHVAALILAVGAAFRGSDGCSRSYRLLSPAAWTGFSLTLILYVAVILGPLLPADPGERARGWRELGSRIGQVVRQLPSPDSTFLVAKGRQLVSELAFYVPGSPKVFRWHDPGAGIKSQYELWPGPWDRMGWDCLLVLEEGERLPPQIKDSFLEVEELTQVRIALGRERVRTFRPYLCRGLVRSPW